MNPQKERCLTGTAATIESLLGVPAGPGGKDAPLAPVLESAGHAFGAPRADRVFFYNPDAVARWVVAKRAREFAPLVRRAGLQLPLHSVLPPVTPVCFASMYSGLLPAAHGIQSYVKPVLQVPTVFDTLPAAGRRAAIVSTAGDSISMIFLVRPVDYFIYKTVAECNAKALALIDADEYDFLVLYNGDYDTGCTATGRRARWRCGRCAATWTPLSGCAAASWSAGRSTTRCSPLRLTTAATACWACWAATASTPPATWRSRIFTVSCRAAAAANKNRPAYFLKICRPVFCFGVNQVSPGVCSRWRMAVPARSRPAAPGTQLTLPGTVCRPGAGTSAAPSGVSAGSLE